MPRVWKEKSWRAVVLVAGCLFLTVLVWPQQYRKFDRDFAESMLRNVASDVQKYYYDAKLHDVDWDARVRQAKENLDKADSMDAAVSEIAALLDILNDSHTSLALPARNYIHDYGFRMKLIGERCYVTRVRSGSDAEKKGLKPGDEILALNEHPVSRKTLWRIEYIYYELRPQPGLRLTLRSEDGHVRQLEVMAKVEPSTVTKYPLHQGINQIVRDRDDLYHQLQATYFEKGDGLLVVRIPAFALSASEVDNIIATMRKHKGVVLDLRGNPGGFVETVDRLLGGMFENDLKIYDRVTRASTKSISVAGRHHDAFTGRLVVIVDSDSASASELFARVVQLEKRAFVLGDRTSGRVMEARFYRHETFIDSSSFYGASVTVADLVMTDGKSLEHVGVEPDIEVLPTAQDLATRRDPAMAKAAGLVGVKLSPEEAGAAFQPDHQQRVE
jgi:C-terminal processing protease CtpA/Prc